MEEKKLSNLELKNLTEADVGRILSDGGALYGTVRKYRDGKIYVYFAYKYRDGSGSKSVPAGCYPENTLAEIRASHRALKVSREKGIDPVNDKKITRQRARLEQARISEHQNDEMLRLAAEKAARKAFADAIEAWAKLELSRRKDGGEGAMRAIRKDILPVLGPLALTDVTRPMLLDALDAVVTRGAKVMANHLFADLRQFYNYAVRRDWVPAHPLAGFKKEHIGGKQKERTRHLTEAEIQELNEKLSASRLKPTTINAIWIMMATLCRVGEISRARWEEVNFERGEWRIPVENAKNGESLVVYLSGFARERFLALKEITGDTPWCLPNTQGNSHICLKSISKQIKDRQTGTPQVNRTKHSDALVLSGGHWTPHDLRRTGSTLMGELGINSDVIERCMNHVEGNKLKRIYQQYEYKNEKQDAWKKVGDRLDLLTRKDSCNVLKFSPQIGVGSKR